ncbi:GNAT family N-acetyltransferase [Paenibacillus swuensis]|uniref:GNAT family N-acetyltransferase n=1 Tax=Paenibacillus swuensis TaxID=1178515 RepID=UPI000B0AEFD4
MASRYEEINLTVKDEQSNVMGGVLAEICWNWLEVDILWVDADLRKQGIGTQLLAEVEQYF